MAEPVRRLDVTTASTNEPLPDAGPVGVCVLELAPGQALQTCVPRGCTLVLLGVRGRLELAAGQALTPGQLVLWPRGAPLTLRAGGARSGLWVLAVPAGAEQVLTALARQGLPAETVVALAADCGVELLLG